MRRGTQAVFTILLIAASASAENWPQWRGPRLNGVSREKNLPLNWSTKENVTWRLAMPGRSGSTPIIWDNRIFLNVADGSDLSLWCVDRTRGNVLWKKHIGSGNVKMQKQNMSSPSPVTDGENVYVMTGTGILKGYDLEGKELWARDIQKDYGKFGLNHGYASSPLLHGDALYLQVIHGMKTDEPSYVLRIDTVSGKTVWKVLRTTDAVTESPDSYSTPTLLRNGKHVELVVSGGDFLTGHDLATGKELWRAGGFNPNNEPNYRVIASPVAIDGLVIASTRVRPVQAFRAGGRGDITASHRLWQFMNGPDVPTPASDGTHVYSVGDKGIVWCLDAKTGKTIWGPERIKPGTYSSSPVLADGKLYVMNEDGLTTVIKPLPKFEVLAENDLDEYILSSPAISDGQIFIRTAQYLYCIGKRSAQ